MTPFSPPPVAPPPRRFRLRDRASVTDTPRQPWFVNLARPRPAAPLFKPLRTTGHLDEAGTLAGRET